MFNMGQDLHFYQATLSDNEPGTHKKSERINTALTYIHGVLKLAFVHTVISQKNLLSCLSLTTN